MQKKNSSIVRSARCTRRGPRRFALPARRVASSHTHILGDAFEVVTLRRALRAGLCELIIVIRHISSRHAHGNVNHLQRSCLCVDIIPHTIRIQHFLVISSKNYTI